MKNDSQSELELVRATKRFGNREVLVDLSLKISKGEFVTVCGRSGVGKSTLLRLLAGLISPDSGQVLWRDKVLTSPPPNTGWVTQNYSASLLPWLNVEKNVSLPLLMSNLEKEELKHRVLSILQKVGLADRRNSYPSELSGGMQQRVALARALVTNPSLLLLDEPFASVDALVRLELEDLLAALVLQKEITTVLVTHDLEEAIYLGDRVLVLAGEPATLRNEFAVNLKKPRNQVSTKGSKKFIEVRRLLFKALAPNK
jgi:NitT/TauT family transport system ATP-binding protein